MQIQRGVFTITWLIFWSQNIQFYVKFDQFITTALFCGSNSNSAI